MRSLVITSMIFLGNAVSAADRVIVVQVPSPPRDWIGLVSALGAPVITLCAVIVAIFTFRGSVRQWRWTYFTKEWSTLMHLLIEQAKFMDPAKTASYRTEFRDDDAIKYDIVARLCIGYLDDLYFLRSEKEMNTWFLGSMRLFGGTHRAWLEANKSSYDQGFYEFIISKQAKQADGAPNAV
ncbi:MAG TPA: hypothetical protein VNN08_06220 [Thermoanaerobaculia bacterium]|nr:hypothetical protein [Thermoanaerobaculia bacterium]